MGAGYRIRAAADGRGEIWLYEDIGEGFFGGVSAKQFAEDLKALGPVTGIDLRINSYGGEVFAGLAMYRLLSDHPAPIDVHIDGVAASCASVVAMAGDTIAISKAGFLMIHNASGVAIGDAGVMRDMASLLDNVSEQLTGIYAARTGEPPERVRAWMAEETWFNADDALASGFVTSVIDNKRAAAHAAPSAMHKFRRPVPFPCSAPARPEHERLAAQVGLRAAQRRVLRLPPRA